LGGVELVVEGAIFVEDSGIIGAELAKWVDFAGPSLWVDLSFPWSATNFGSNWSFWRSCWTTVKHMGFYLDSAKIR
jgi:hypothetical protein